MTDIACHSWLPCTIGHHGLSLTICTRQFKKYSDTQVTLFLVKVDPNCRLGAVTGISKDGWWLPNHLNRFL